MVVLNNIMDIKDLKFKLFKTLACPCELCQCGCFERNKYNHSKECKHKGQKIREKQAVLGSIQCPLTHYKETFKPHLNIQPTASQVPVPERYGVQVPMDFNTVTKSEYKPIKNFERAQPLCIDERHYEAPNQPFTAVTSYQKDFVLDKQGLFNKTVRKNPNEITMSLPKNKIYDDSTSKEHYRRWSKSVNDTYGYFETRTLAGEAIFPTNERHFATTTSSVHKYLSGSRAEAYVPEESDALKEKGSVGSDTVYRDTYVVHKNAKKAAIIRPKQRRAKSTYSNTDNNFVTQTHSDFIPYGEQQLTQKVSHDFYMSNLNRQIYPDKIHLLASSYSSEYPGYDPLQNPRPKAFKTEEVYKPPSEDIDLETVTMREFKPIDVSKVPKLTVKKYGTLKNDTKPMQTETTSKANFINYNVKPITKASDPSPQMFVRPRQKFAAVTTNSQQFYAKNGEKSVNCKSTNGDHIQLNGEMDMNTNHRHDYKNHGLSLCGAKAYFLAKALDEKQNSRVQ